MRFALWLESIMQPLAVLNRQQVIDIQNAADAGGKHGKTLTPDHYSWIKEGEYYLVDAPIEFLDFDLRPEGRPTSYPAGPEGDKRINDYMSRPTEAPPILLRYSDRTAKRKCKLMTVTNGNHRTEAAARSGKSTIRAIISRTDLERWHQCII